MQFLLADAYGHYVERLGRPPAPMLVDCAELARSGDVTLALLRGDLLGMIVVRVRADHVLVDDLAVSPAAQGSGLGSRLLRRAEEIAASHGTPTVRLFTNEVMTENLRFYARRGYVEVARRVEDGYCRVLFEKRVTPSA